MTFAKSILALMCACGTSSCAMVGPLDELRILQAKKVCEDQGRMRAKDGIAAEGYLRLKNISSSLNSVVGFQDIAKEFLEKRFAFLEMEQDYWTDPRTGRNHRRLSNKLFEHAIGNGTKFYRLYLASLDSPACAGFLEEIKTHQWPELPYLRVGGLPLDLCIAAERTDEVLSRFEMGIEGPWKATAVGAWSQRWYVRDRWNGEIVAEVTHNGYNGFNNPLGPGPSFECENEKEIQRFEASAIRAIPDERVAPPVKWSVVDPEHFAHSFELQSRLVSRHQVNARISEYDYVSKLNPVADNGNIFFNWDVLNVINGRVGKRTKIHAFGRAWEKFQHLRLERNGFLFVGEPARSRLNDRDIAIFHYSREGLPVVVYRVQLPDMQLQGNVRYLVDNVALTNNAIELTILDVSGRNGPMTVLSRYEIRAPIAANAP